MNYLSAATAPIPVTDDSLHFAQPIWMLVGLLVCAGLVALFIRFDRRRDADLAKLIHPRFRQRLTEGFSPRLRNFKRGLWILGVWLAFAAIARPQMGFEWHEVKRKGIDILFAVDTSRSMLAEDLKPNRLERARLGILDFVDKLEGDRVGLIPFAGSAFALCPLTLDYDAFRESLNALDTDLIPRQGTDLASAIKEAERLFDETGNNHRVLVLLTDGEDLQGDVIDSAKAAAKKGMSIYTVGVGSPEGGTIPVRLRNGRTDFVRDEKGEIVRTTLDEATLKKIAEATDALYVPLGRGAEGLNTIYQERLRLVPKSEMDQRMERRPLERFEWPLGAAIAVLLLEYFIRDRRKVRVARPPLSGAEKVKSVSGVTGLLMFVGFLMGSGEVRAAELVSAAQDPRAVYNRGTEAYTNGDFSAASDSLKSSLRTSDLTLQQRAYYNLGNSLYRVGQGALEKDPKETIKAWEESVKAYDDALALNESDEDARFNKELVERKLEELKNQEQQDDESQDQDGDQDQEQEQEEGEEDSEGEEGEEGEDSEGSEDENEGEESGEEGKPGEDEESQEGEESEEGAEGEEQEEGEEDGEQSGEAQEGEEQEGEEQEGEMSEERGEKQEMTPEEAKQLLEALRDDERTVIPIPQQPRSRFTTPQNSTKGKTW